jgi:hypothetical protein
MAPRRKRSTSSSTSIDSGVPGEALKRKLKKDISFALRRGTIAQVTTALRPARRRGRAHHRPVMRIKRRASVKRGGGSVGLDFVPGRRRVGARQVDSSSRAGDGEPSFRIVAARRRATRSRAGDGEPCRAASRRGKQAEERAGVQGTREGRGRRRRRRLIHTSGGSPKVG